MPVYHSSIQRLIDPFSIPSQMSNMGILIVTYVTTSIHNQTHCIDHDNQPYLFFIYYGSNIVCFTTLILSILYISGVVDFLFNKVIPCGEVCLTINTLIMFVAGVVYHCVATLYGVWEVLVGEKSQCVQLEMFKKITCFIYLLWLFVIVLFLIANLYKDRVRNKLNLLNQRLIEL